MTDTANHEDGLGPHRTTFCEASKGAAEREFSKQSNRRSGDADQQRSTMTEFESVQKDGER